MGRTATFSSQEQQRLRQVAFKAGVSSEGRASEATWKKVKQLFNEVPPCQARSCEALRKHFQRNIALKRRREAANEDDGNNGDDSDDDDKEAQAEHIVRSLRSDLREAASERCSPPWMQMTWTQRLAAVQEYARERGQLVRFDGAFVYASPQASPSPLDLHEENVKRRRIGDESAPEEQAKDAGVAEPGLEEGGADGPPGADQAQKKAGRKKISYDEYNRIGNMLVGYLAREAEEGRIVMEEDLVTWYFEQVDDEIQTEAQLMEQVGLVHFIINRMISKDRIIIVQQASADPQRPGMRTLVKHPNYLVPTHRPDRSPTEMPVPTQMPSPTSAAEDEDGMQAVAGTQLEGLPLDAFMPQPLFAPPGMVVLGCMGMPDPPPPGGGFLSEVVAWSLAALLLIAYVTYVGIAIAVSGHYAYTLVMQQNAQLQVASARHAELEQQLKASDDAVQKFRTAAEDHEKASAELRAELEQGKQKLKASDDEKLQASTHLITLGFVGGALAAFVFSLIHPQEYPLAVEAAAESAATAACATALGQLAEQRSPPTTCRSSPHAYCRSFRPLAVSGFTTSARATPVPSPGEDRGGSPIQVATEKSRARKVRGRSHVPSQNADRGGYFEASIRAADRRPSPESLRFAPSVEVVMVDEGVGRDVTASRGGA